MSLQHPPLTPYPLALLLGRVVTEWESRRKIFDLPASRFFKPEQDIDLSVEIFGQRIGTPVGPAAGPHTQLAQNIVLGWLAGARSFELKTVQILDELQIDRPCIDMATVGYNVEWSQELTLDQSLHEYVKAWLMLHALSHWEPLSPLVREAGDHIFELSVGYDLAGIQSERLARFIGDLRNAEVLLTGLREEVPPPFKASLERPLSPQIIQSATLSTFHGCPPEEIEAIARHLMAAHDLDVTIKLNPTLLGEARVREILHKQLGYHELQLLPDAFADDLTFAQAVNMINVLVDFAHKRGRTFGIKLTNTLVVANHKGWLPGERMYLSGPPLHVLAMCLLEELEQSLPKVLRLGTRPRGVPVAFSAGIDRSNVSGAIGLGLTPVTICSDLLKPGGYGRLAPMLRHLVVHMRETGCQDISAWLAQVEQSAQTTGQTDALAAYVAGVTSASGRRRYSHIATNKQPRQTAVKLAMWDCCSCNLCVTVCPNDAMTRLQTPADLHRPPPVGMEQKWQYVCLAELCNECGNCTVFCPEQGEPFAAKPRLFVYNHRFVAETGQAFLVRKAAADQKKKFTVTAHSIVASQQEKLAALLNGPTDLPLRCEYLPDD